MNEIIFLNCYLLIAFVVAPLMTNSFFLNGSKTYSDAHKTALIILVAGTLLGINYATLIWPLFCAYGFILYLQKGYKPTECIPFIFSLISSVWFVSGANDWQLLGYGKEWSFYAALHGSFIGWLFVGCLASLPQKIYQLGCYFSFILFLLVAFGIDGIPYIKPIGVIGLSFMLPILIGHYAFHIKREKRLARFLAAISLGSIILSMTLAVLNEFWIEFPRMISNVHIMVLTHGFLNAVIAIPFFLLAIKFERYEHSGPNQGVVLFDDVCVLCSRSVVLLTKLDKKRKLKYSSLRGKFSQTLRISGQLDTSESVAFWSEGVVYDRAEAVIHIAIKLGGIYKVIGLSLKIIPLYISNAFYDLIARNRYKLFGKKDACLIPTEEQRDLFIP